MLSNQPREMDSNTQQMHLREIEVLGGFPRPTMLASPGAYSEGRTAPDYRRDLNRLGYHEARSEPGERSCHATRSIFCRRPRCNGRA